MSDHNKLLAKQSDIQDNVIKRGGKGSVEPSTGPGVTEAAKVGTGLTEPIEEASKMSKVLGSLKGLITGPLKALGAVFSFLRTVVAWGSRLAGAVQIFLGAFNFGVDMKKQLESGRGVWKSILVAIIDSMWFIIDGFVKMVGQVSKWAAEYIPSALLPESVKAGFEMFGSLADEAHEGAKAIHKSLIPSTKASDRQAESITQNSASTAGALTAVQMGANGNSHGAPTAVTSNVVSGSNNQSTVVNNNGSDDSPSIYDIISSW
jgi:hypothetical protein